MDILTTPSLAKPKKDYFRTPGQVLSLITSLGFVSELVFIFITKRCLIFTHILLFRNFLLPCIKHRIHLRQKADVTAAHPPCPAPCPAAEWNRRTARSVLLWWPKKIRCTLWLASLGKRVRHRTYTREMESFYSLISPLEYMSVLYSALLIDLYHLHRAEQCV